MKFGDNQFYKPAMIVDNTSSFLTKAFFIRFCEEEIDLNDFCHFRIEFEVKPKYENINLFMEVELMFQDCLSNANANNNSNGENGKDSNVFNFSILLFLKKFSRTLIMIKWIPNPWHRQNLE